MNGSFDWQSALGWAPLQVRESWSDSTCNLKKEIGTVYLLLWLVTRSEVKDTHSGQHFVNIFTSPQSPYQNAQRTGNLSPSKTRCHTHSITHSLFFPMMLPKVSISVIHIATQFCLGHVVACLHTQMTHSLQAPISIDSVILSAEGWQICIQKVSGSWFQLLGKPS